MDETQKTMFYPSGRIKQVKGRMKPNPANMTLKDYFWEEEHSGRFGGLTPTFRVKFRITPILLKLDYVSIPVAMN